MVKRISFEEFYLGVREIITPELTKVLNPQIGRFYKSGNTYLQVDFPEVGQLHVEMAIGKGMEFMRDIRKSAIDDNIQIITYTTSEYNKVTEKIAKYYGFVLYGIEEDYYGENHSGHCYLLDVKETKRFGNS